VTTISLCFWKANNSKCPFSMRADDVIFCMNCPDQRLRESQHRMAVPMDMKVPKVPPPHRNKGIECVNTKRENDPCLHFISRWKSHQRNLVHLETEHKLESKQGSFWRLVFAHSRPLFLCLTPKNPRQAASKCLKMLIIKCFAQNVQVELEISIVDKRTDARSSIWLPV